MRASTKLGSLATVAVALVLAGPLPALAPTAVEYAVVGPVGLARGETARTGLLLPAVQKVREAAVVRLVLVGLGGDILGSAEFFVAPGQGGTADLAVLGDGSVRLNGEPIKAFVGEGERLECVPFLMVGSRSGGVRALASLQLMEEEGLHAHLILPYIEQDNLR